MKRFLVLSALIALVAVPAVLACEMEASTKTAAGHECPAMMKGVERAVTNVDHGVKLELTSSDPAVVRQLQQRMAEHPASAGCCKECPLANAAWTRKAENVSNGVVLTLTAGSAAEIGKLQQAVEGMAKGECPHAGAAGKGECPRKAGAKTTKA